MAFLLATLVRLISTLLTLAWTRWLLHAMGPVLYGVFISFQALVTIGTMGDFGLGGTVGIETNRLLGARRMDELGQFLARARTAFFILAILAATLFALASPWLIKFLGLEHVLVGSTGLLFLVGVFMIAGTVLANFTTGLSNACQNLTWPILPNLLFTQLALGFHLLLAQHHVALWKQILPYAIATFLMMILPWVFTRISHPPLAKLAPVFLGWHPLRRLLSQSFWVYLWSFGFLIYTTTDRLVINRFFGPEVTSRYYLNYKPSEMAIFLLATLTFFTLTKIIQWHCSPENSGRQKAKDAALRLQRVQVFLGLTAALALLALNHAFVRFWLGPNNDVPMLLQALFAANLAVTIGGDAGTKIAGQISGKGTIFAGAMVGVTALLNLSLSILAGKTGWLPGVAAATLFAQIFFGLTTGNFTARQLGLSPGKWIYKSTALPLFICTLGFIVCSYVAPTTYLSWSIVFFIFFLLLAGAALNLGINQKLVQEELVILRSMIQR